MVEVVVVVMEEEVGDGKKVQFSRGVMSDIMLWRAEHAGFMGASRGGCPTHTNNSKKRLEWQVAVVVILSFALFFVSFFSFLSILALERRGGAGGAEGAGRGGGGRSVCVTGKRSGQ